MKKKRKWKKVLGLLFLIILICIGYIGFKFGHFLFSIREEPNSYVDSNYNSTESYPPVEMKQSPNKLNVLLLGIDARANEPSRTDTIIVLSIDKKTKDAVMISIPRDTRVNIPGRGLDKINHAHAFGGVNLTIAALEEFLEIPIHHYARINFPGFKDIIDVLGGVTIDVESNVADLTPELRGKAGVNKLNGEEALAYVRFRMDSQGDIGRVKRQQKFLQAVFRDSVQPSIIVKAPSLLDSLGENLRTNIPAWESISLGTMFLSLSLDELPMAMIPGKGQYINHISYWIPDLDKMEEVFEDLGVRD
ncbi:LCP family protein [Candidatus Contubernalis alkaliaceticus]|uniref:LCP family protein n=1 Tax=Candidatus Contubernalis alkaliaceticus TaxID=338645 RepID=UPI001F4C444F|nr:LCP family protein [Candidatus Contubernalis alkalaceticus]UNC93652.1 LCP family protein [Candidatus Contubernalis alkalaceticus]